MYRIGIDLGGTKMDGVLMDNDGEIIHSTRYLTPQDYVGVVKAIKQTVDELEEVAGRQCPVGLGTPGAWVSAKGAMKNSNSTSFNGKPLLSDLKKLLNRPIRIANDADCMAVSETVDGAAKGASNVFAVIIGTGVGAGWVVNGQLLQGPNGLAGEWGHNTFPRVYGANAERFALDFDKERRECYCGRINCVETFLAGRGLEQTYETMHGSHLSSEEIGKQQTEESRETIKEYILQLALALTIVVNIGDPEVIVLAGGVSQIENLYPPLPQLIKEFAFSSEGLTQVRPAVHGSASGRRGAAWLFPPVE